MAETEKHPIRNSVISGLILAAIISLVSLIPGGWGWVWRIAEAGGRWTLEKHPVSGWIIAVAILCALAALALACFRFWELMNSPVSQTAAPWESYRKDTFDGLTWRWKYSGEEIFPLVCFCPQCDQQLQPHHASEFAAIDRIGFTCDNCRRELPTFEMSWDALQGRTKRSIERRIRSGEWKNV